MTTRAEVRAFGRKLRRGDLVSNRFREHGYDRGERILGVVQDVPGRAFFILRDTMTQKVTWMRTRTLLERYSLEPDAGETANMFGKRQRLLREYGYYGPREQETDTGATEDKEQ